MSDEIKNILSNSNKDIDNQKLMNYLSKKLSTKEAYDVENNMNNDAFVNDAIEGLEQLNNKKNIDITIKKLNNNLYQSISKKKERKNKLKLKEQPYIYFAIILLMILLFVGFIVIKKHQSTNKLNNNSKIISSIFILPKY